MSFFSAEQRRTARAIGDLSYCNQFLPERIELEKRILGAEFVAIDPVWYASAEDSGENVNVERIHRCATTLLSDARRGLGRGSPPSAEDAGLYADVVSYWLFYKHVDAFWEHASSSLDGGGPRSCLRFYKRFLTDGLEWLEPLGLERDWTAELTHLFACFYQLRRAFAFVFRRIYGGSMTAAELRARVWESIFTHDVRRYRRALYDRMGNVPTLITGESGTGKEIVARAIGLSRFVPFDVEKGAFAQSIDGLFHAVNPSALSPTLIESELFGHRRGSFTGALEDRAGFFEVCGRHGTIFLDEVGDLDAAIQVKLLRALQDRSFQRLGETAPRRFEGKVIAATHRDLSAEMEAGRFREDFFYRLCADRIQTPPLRDQVAGNPEELASLVHVVASNLVGKAECEALTSEVMATIERRLGFDYRWPGNFRELEQCVRNVLVREDYQPTRIRGGGDLGPFAGLLEGQLSADELLSRYATVVYSQTHNYEETARRLGIDRRTVKSRIQSELLRELEGSAEDE